MSALRSAHEVELALSAAPSTTAVARLVVAGMASRSRLGVDRLEDLQLAVETVLRRSNATDDVFIRMRPAGDALSIRVGPLPGADGALAELEDVLSGLVDGIELHDTDGEAWVDLEVTHGSLAPAGR